MADCCSPNRLTTTPRPAEERCAGRFFGWSVESDKDVRMISQGWSFLLEEDSQFWETPPIS